MNRQTAVSAVNDRINVEGYRIKVEGSGQLAWLRHTKSNNSFNRSANSAASIEDLNDLEVVSAPG